MVAAVGIPLLPLVILGYGTDIDNANVRAAGEAFWRGEYRISRPPGSLIHEASTAVLDRVGGAIAVNLGSVLAGVTVVVVVAALLRRAGAAHPELAALAIAANPHFVIAATSLADHLWALALLLLGIDAAQRRRTVWAGILWGLAISCRMSTLVLVLAYVGAELTVRRRKRRRSAESAVLALVVGAISSVPAWLSVGRSGHFLAGAFGSPTLLNLLGRSLVKQELFVGIPALVVLAVGLRPLAAGLRMWRRSPLLCFAVLGGVGMEVVFLRLPWKLGHLLPVLVCLVVVAALSPRIRPAWFIAFALAQIAWGLVAVRALVPDVRNDARGARADIAIVAGPLIRDIRCRIDAVGESQDGLGDEARAIAGYACTTGWAYGPDSGMSSP